MQPHAVTKVVCSMHTTGVLHVYKPECIHIKIQKDTKHHLGFLAHINDILQGRRQQPKSGEA